MSIANEQAPAKINRSMPRSAIIPELAYPDVSEAAAWLCRAFGFTERLRIGGHRVQLTFGDGAIVVTESRYSAPAEAGARPAEQARDISHSIMMRVADADLHCEQAQRSGARILHAPTDHPYGERQYTAQDLGGHYWTFSQTIADIDPAAWGGELFA